MYPFLGKIVESGSYEHLISLDGQFKRLVNRQMLNNDNTSTITNPLVV